MQPKLGILGAGRAAWAFASTWRRIGWPLAGVWSRGSALDGFPRASIEELSSESDLLLLAVSDRAIHEVAALVPETRAIIVHASGSLTSIRGGFSLHPLKSLPPAGEPSDLRDTLLVFEGNHRDLAQEFAAAAGARFAEIRPEQKTLYHAAAVIGSNYVAALLDIASQLIGIDDARGDLAALARSAIDNWQRHDGRGRFTGPAVRGDRAVLDAHLEALRDRPELAEVYRILAAHIAAG